MAEETWNTIEGPILEAVRDAEVAGSNLNAAARGAVPDLPDHLYERTIRSLADDDYLQVGQFGPERDFAVDIWRLLPDGRRAIGQWPSGDLGASLVEELQRQIDAEPNEERKGKLRSVLGVVLDVGQEVLTDVLAKMANRSLGQG